MSTAAHRYKILAHMFRRAIRTLDQIQNSSTAQVVATKAFAAPAGSFALDKITDDFVQTEATKFFARVASEIGY